MRWKKHRLKTARHFAAANFRVPAKVLITITYADLFCSYGQKRTSGERTGAVEAFERS